MKSKFTFTSQYHKSLPKDWQWRSCGIAALKILMDYWHKEDPKNQSPSLKELLATGLKLGAYKKGVGWYHAGLVNIAKAYGYEGYNRDLNDRRDDAAYSAIEEETNLRPVILSVYSKLDPKLGGGHLVVAYKSGNLTHIIDPEQRTVKTAYKTLSRNKFIPAFKKRLVLIRPGAKTKLERLLNSKIELHKSYMSMIHGSIGTKMFQHLFLNLDKKSVNVLEGGGLSCAVYMSSVLYLWGLVGDTHAKTAHVLTDMENHGWKKISKPKIGCIIEWEPKWAMRQFAHIGFYVGKGRAVSNDSGKSNVPKLHHFTYGPKGSKAYRKIVGMYWHPALDR